MQDVIALYRTHESNNSIHNEEKGFQEIFEIVGRYRPDPAAAIGLSHHHTTYAVALIKEGNLTEGFRHFANHGRLSVLFEILMRKITMKIW